MSIKTSNSKIDLINRRIKYGTDGGINVDAGTFFVDPSNNYIGINTLNPSKTLDVSGTIYSSSSIVTDNLTSNRDINISKTPESLITGSIKFAAGLAVTSSSSYSSYAVSYDGINWSRVINSLGSNVKGIFYSPEVNLWGAAGSSGTNYFSYSTDGINWTISPSNDISFNRGEAIGYSPNDNVWVGVGRGSPGNGLAYSTNNLRSWTKITTGINLNYAYTVYYSKNQRTWVTGGNGTDTLGYSYDGINWTGLGSSIFTTTRNVTYSTRQNLWVAVGSGTNTIAYSNNGINWTGLGATIFTTSGIAVEYSEPLNMWVAVGSGTNTLAYSYDGINWTGLGTTFFSNGGTGVSYSNVLNMWSAIGGGTINSAYSYDGVNWIASSSPVLTGVGTWFNVSSFSTINFKINTDNSGNTSIINTNNILFNNTGSLSLNSYVGINTTSPTTNLDISSNKIRVRSSLTPTALVGNTGDICWDDNRLYVKTNAGWKYVSLTSL
jgi:hypothetical protein